MTALLLLKFIFGNLELKLNIFYQTLKVFLFFGHDFDFLLIVFLKLNTVEMTWYFLVYFLKQLLRLFKFEGHSFHLLGVFFVQLALIIATFRTAATRSPAATVAPSCATSAGSPSMATTTSLAREWSISRTSVRFGEIFLYVKSLGAINSVFGLAKS